jgi:hypothetical protein
MKKRFRPVWRIMITTSCVTFEEKKEEKIVGDEDKRDNALKGSPSLASHRISKHAR